MKDRISLRIGFIGLLLAIHTSLQAEQKRTLTIDEVRSHAIAHGREAKRIDASFAEQYSKVIQIEQMQNPTLSASTNVPTSNKSNDIKRQLNLTLSHSFRLSDFELRSSVSNLLSGLTDRDKQVKLLELMQQISLSYYQLWALREEKLHIEDRRRRATRISKIITDSLERGQSTLAEVHVSTANEAESRADLLGVQSEILDIERELLNLTALNLSNATLSRPKFTALRPMEEVFETALRNKDSLGKRITLHAKLAREKLKLAKSDRYPTITPRLSYSRNEDGIEFAGVGFTIPLPIYNRNQARIAQAQSELSHRERELLYVDSGEFRQDLSVLYEQVNNKIKQAQLYENQVLPRLKQSMTLSEEAFANAQLSLMELWSIQNKYHDAFDRSIALRVEAYSTLTELSLITGELEF